MIVFQSSKRVGRVSLLVFPFFGLISVLGCTDEYPADMKYALRDDPLLVSNISAVPTHWDKPGDFPKFMLSGLPTQEREDMVKKFISPTDISALADEQLQSALEALFGAPAEPTVGGISEEIRAKLRLDDKTLAAGSIHYRAHCLHCHGVTGNGRGPTAPWVNPHPRDFRQGIFKFTSTLGGNARKPRRDDLLRTVRQGIEGTAMPSFGLIPESDQEAIVSYVIHLSIRGNAEFLIMQEIIEKGLSTSDIKSTTADYVTLIANFWNEAAEEQNIIRPDPNYPIPSGDQRRESIIRGWDLFRKPGDAGCITCHKDYGRQSVKFFDSWGTIGRPIDVTKGMYRGGRRRIDLYWRIHAGVNGSNMPGFANVLASDSFKTQTRNDGIWDLVNFLEVLPYKKMREEYGIQID